MTGPPVRLDFAGPRLRTTVTGVVLFVFGLGAVIAASLEYRAVSGRRASFELQLAAALRRSIRDPADRVHTARLNEEAAGVVRELGTPWTAVLADLEQASRDKAGEVAVLSVEPDHEKHRIRINGESRDLSNALTYVQRLQASRSLRYPMLDSHEVVADDPENPVRFVLTADWQESP